MLALAGAVGPGAAHGIYATGCGNQDAAEELSPGLRVVVKPGLWTVDWTVDCNLDRIRRLSFCACGLNCV